MSSLHSSMRVGSVVATMLATFACGAPANHDSLFSSSSASVAGAAAAIGGAPSSAGTANAGGNSGSAAGSDDRGGSTSAGGSASAGGSSGGAFGGGANGGSPNGGISGGGIAGGEAGENQGGGGATAGGASGGNGGGELADCSAFGHNAMFFSSNKHCYLVVKESAAFADARTRCAMLGAHLVTLSSQAENDFVWSLDGAEHWIGATDGKGPKDMQPGTYSWVDGEPFTYTDWSPGQPNTAAATCSINDGNPCYEHCAFQWSGGDIPGQWNDRLCTHTIDTVCEWDGPK